MYIKYKNIDHTQNLSALKAAVNQTKKMCLKHDQYNKLFLVHK